MPYEMLLEEAQIALERQQDQIDRIMSPVTDEMERWARQYGTGILQDILKSIEIKLVAEARTGEVIPLEPKGFFWNEYNSSQAVASESDCW